MAFEDTYAAIVLINGWWSLGKIEQAKLASMGFCDNRNFYEKDGLYYEPGLRNRIRRVCRSPKTFCYKKWGSIPHIIPFWYFSFQSLQVCNAPEQYCNGSLLCCNGLLLYCNGPLLCCNAPVQLATSKDQLNTLRCSEKAVRSYFATILGEKLFVVLDRNFFVDVSVAPHSLANSP